ncbi:MAG: YceI-like domain protein [Planctomycetaceae bacterium]|nr:YceI-like domain protein [Planctomycetaceae bacterium]
MIRVVSLLCLKLMAMALVFASASASAQPAAGPRGPAVDLKTSRVYVLVDKTGIGHPHGVVGSLKSGTVTLGAKAKAGQIVFDMKSFVADTDDARKYVGLAKKIDAETQKKVTETMLGEHVLDVEHHPTATFDIDSAIATGKKSAAGHPLFQLDGRFTLHGTTQPLKVIAEAISGAKPTRLRTQFKVEQSNFGMKPYTTGFGTVGVADELTIWGDVELLP